MKVVRGAPLEVPDLFVGRFIVLSDQIIYCPNCKANFAYVGNSVGEVTEIIDDKTYRMTYKYNIPSCPTCKSYILSMTVYESIREEQKEKHQEILHKSGALN